MSNFKAGILAIWYIIAFLSGATVVMQFIHFDRDELKISLFLLVMAIYTIKALWQKNDYYE